MWNKALFICGCLSISLATPADPASYLQPPPSDQQAKDFQQFPSTVSPSQSKELEPTISLEPPFYQRVAQWFGIGGTDEPEPFPSSKFQQRHLAASSQADPAVKPKKSQCNPCNKVPWTPMINGQRSLSNGGSEVNSFNSGYPVYSSYRSIPSAQSQTKLKYFENRTHQANGYNTFSNQAAKEEYHNFAALRQQPKFQSGRPQFYQPVFQHYPNYNFFKTYDHSLGQRIALPTYKPKLAYPTPSSYSGPSITSPDYQPPQSLLPLQYSPKHHLLPIPLPNLSMVPLPPLFGAKPFRAINSYGQTDQSSNPYSNQYQPQGDYIYSSVQPQTTPSTTPDDVIIIARTPTTPYPSVSSDVEIIPSISLGDFSSSVVYPIERPNSPFGNVEHKHSEGYSQPDYLGAPIVVDQNYYQSPPNDNYHSASSSNASFEQPEFDREGSIKTIQSQLINSRPSSPITILPDLFPPETTMEPKFESSSPQTLPNIGWSNKRERGTPKNLLDSPIYYMNKSQQRTTKSPDTFESRLPDMDNTPWTPSVQQGILSITSPLPTVYTERPSRSNTFNQNHFHSSGNLEDPVHKRPKQIQIIIPYTTKNRNTLNIDHQSPPQPSRFQNFDSSNGWSVQSHQTDQHDSQESKLITSTVTQASVPPKTTKILTKIVAANLKELLHNEKSNATSLNSIVDISRLQKNIDVWTEQEFSTPNKASTVSLSQTKAKIIPSEYLTTTPIPSKTEPNSIPVPITTVEPFLSDQAYTKYDDDQSNIIDSNDSSDLWTKLMLSISPSTKEKVYVVTPQPWRNTPSVEYTKRAGSGFKSSRFVVRPTPGPQSTSSAEVGFSFPESGK